MGIYAGIGGVMGLWTGIGIGLQFILTYMCIYMYTVYVLGLVNHVILKYKVCTVYVHVIINVFV